ncbi:MAG: LysR family transcriptional regulator [Haliea sp.]|uniref:LysR family transcriptional regulator n=1 Tax=Haliea sp. TaxID=1932666 RepID=UPI0032EB8FBE
MIDIRSVDLNLLYVLQVLLEERSVSRTAVRLHLTQPTVSGMLARLRSTFNDPLFVRSSHGLRPTRQAIALGGDLEKIIRDIEALMQPAGFDPRLSTVRFRLSTNDYMQYVFLSPAIRALQSEAPDMQFALMRPEVTGLYDKLVSGDIDLAVTIPEFSDVKLREQLVYSERYVAVVRKNHPALGRKLTLARFLELDHCMVSPADGQFHGPTDLALAQMNKRRRVTVSTSSFFTLIELVSNSDHIAMLPKRLADKFADRLEQMLPPVPVPGFDVILAWHQRSDKDPVRRWLVERLSGFAGSM